jgi:putative transposase
LRDAGDPSCDSRRERRLIAAEDLGKEVGVSKACEALGVSRATLYRRRGGTAEQPIAARSSPRSLTEAEESKVRETLYSERFMDQSPHQIYAALLDEDQYLCSVRTMYRILDKDKATKERRNQLRRPNYRKPELLASASNQVWSWDITKLKGPEKWTYYYLYVIVDIYSRYTVGWMLAHREQSELAQTLINRTIEKQNVSMNQLTIHSDRGPSMTSHGVADLLSSLGVTRSLSRPHVSNDNPFSESQFKTLKYRPDFPQRFGSYEDGVSHCRRFFEWYNNEHYHSGIGYVTPTSLHYGQADQVIENRQRTLEVAYAAHPQRFVKGVPKPAQLPAAVWINPPLNAESETRKENELPTANCPGELPEASLTHPRSDYPSASCVSAELTSVSSDNIKIHQQKSFDP